jgi:hypothetical protein
MIHIIISNNKMLFYIKIFYFILVFIVIWLFYNYTKSKNFDRYYAKDIKVDELNTGDILLLEYQNINNVLLSALFFENFMHPVIVLKEEGEVKIIEQVAKKGLVKKRFSEWLEYNDRAIILVNRLECPDEDRKLLGEKLSVMQNKYSKILSPAPSFSLKWKRFWWPEKDYHRPDYNNMVCLEATAWLLAECGMVNKNKSLESYLPRAYEKMEGFDLKAPFMFKEFYLVNSFIF